MRFHSVTYAALLAGAALIASSAFTSAEAALIHNFVDKADGSIVGSIEFSAETPGTVTSFSFSGFGGPNLGLPDICLPTGGCELVSPSSTTSWSIDQNWDLNNFVLAIDLGGFFGVGSDTEIRFKFASPATLGDGSGRSISMDGICDASCESDGLAYLNELALRLVAIPDEPGSEPISVAGPSALASFVSGLFLLGLLRSSTGRRANPFNRPPDIRV